MKKIALYVLVLFSTISVNAQQTFFDRNKNVSFGIQFGAVDQHNNTDFGFQTLMINVSCYGVYLDIGGWPRAYGSDTRIDKWDDESCYAFHIGYQLPVLKWIKITPIVGYYNHKSGYTDGYYWRVTDHGINNKFIVTDKLNGFDYGGNIQIDILNDLVFSAHLQKICGMLE